MRKPTRLVPIAAAAVLAVTTAGAAAAGASGAATHLAAASAASSASRAPGVSRAGPATVRPVLACGQLATAGGDFSNVPDAPAYVLSATHTGRGRAAVCRVTGYIAPQEQFQLALPVRTYTGRYIQAGCGGLCGWSLPQPSSPAANCPTATDLAAASGDQFAGGTDNQGHIGGEIDALWAEADPALRVNFGYTSEHALVQAAKAIITVYYGKPPRYSYYDGCSDGGREGLVEAQRYPRDFTGILAGAPSNIETEALAVVPAWVIAVNTGAHGREILTSQELPALHTAVVKACGNAQGLIEDPRSCGFNPAAIKCPAGVHNSSCLTPAQVHVVREIYLGPSDGHGHYLYPGGEPYGSELEWAGLAIDPAGDRQWPQDTKAYQAGQSWLKYAAYWHNPPASFQLKDFRFTVAAYRKLLPLAGIYDATDPSLSAFRKAGGKLILWQGWADENLSPLGTVAYYRALVRAAGGFRASQAFTRLYLIPDQYHCLDGGFPEVNGLATTQDLLTSLIRWVERGTPPEAFSFPLAHPAGALRAIHVRPLNPLRPPPGGARGLNTRHHWVGRFQPGTELWCRTDGMDLACSHRRPPGSYADGTSAKAANPSTSG
jgi:Tannase and feruloyl esterase